ncbi:hypothetical protein [Nocardia stercoris]|uniref:Uncharacterized protein n=1 Tax=Nocardia stercoris TaxID=2483361 RepID=A0A3M2LBU5_9NOCA|nr:hypothetical protein [Nocardia stercoris]RMI34180.1 hypothetical protein EBN03_07095 [Nocardia stercoris]
MPHDVSPHSEPVLVSLSVPPAARRGLVTGLVRAVSERTDLPVLDLAADDAEVAAFLARIAHADTGFVARTDSGDRALAVVAATAAALCGEDIRAALAMPDIEFLRGLSAPAEDAVRDVLTAIETGEPDAVGSGLSVLEAGR